jgi:outer membrane protein assembly factor BamB
MKNVLIILGAIACATWLASPSATAAGDWPQWRGVNRDGKSTDTGLLKEWPADGPALAWQVNTLGKGYASVSVVGNRLYTMGDNDDASSVLALDAADGKVLWSAKVGKPGAPGWGGFAGPRCTPTVDEGLIFSADQWGELVCVNAADGKEQWRKNYEKDFGASRPEWGWSESPLVEGDRVIVTPGGPQGTMVALNKKTGAVLWQSKEFTDPAHYASAMPADMDGIHTYVQLTAAHAFGVAAKDGHLLWEFPRKGVTAVIPTPICADHLVYVTSGYGVGCNLLKLASTDGKFDVEQVYANKNMVNHHGGVIKLGDQLYGYSDGKGWVCQDFKTGDIVWSEKDKLKKGSVTFADGHLVCREEDTGTVALLEATPTGYVEKGRFKQPDRAKEKAWPHPTIANGKLYLRDQDLLLCYELKAK